MKAKICLSVFFALLVTGISLPPVAWSMSTDTKKEAKDSKEAEYYKNGEAAIKAWKWQEAVKWMTMTVKRNPANADAHNYLGYAYRNLKKYDASLKHYKQALKLSPKHRGAHEYIGQAYLQMNDLANAEKHLKALDELCFFGCDEYDELKAAVAAFKKKQKKSS